MWQPRWFQRARALAPRPDVRFKPGDASLTGAWEADLDVLHGHFGPTLWCRTWTEWLQELRLDAPPQVFIVADCKGERRVTAVLEPADAQTLPQVDGEFPHLKYYRTLHGQSVAVSFALEAFASSAAD